MFYIESRNVKPCFVHTSGSEIANVCLGIQEVESFCCKSTRMCLPGTLVPWCFCRTLSLTCWARPSYWKGEALKKGYQVLLFKGPGKVGVRVSWLPPRGMLVAATEDQDWVAPQHHSAAAGVWQCYLWGAWGVVTEGKIKRKVAPSSLVHCTPLWE
jgi:hypothetical protein